MPEAVEEKLSTLFGEEVSQRRRRQNTLTPDTVPILSIDDLLDTLRELQGEDEVTGMLPVGEMVVDVDLSLPEEDTSPVFATTWSDKERVRLLSRITAETLHTLLEKIHGNAWWEAEPEVLLEDLHSRGVILNGVGITKFRTLQSLLRSPQSRCPFYTDPEAFRFCTVALSGRATTSDDLIIPTPIEMAVAMHIMATVRPFFYTEEVLGMIAACCLHSRLWCLPSPLNLAQDRILEICGIMDFPVDKERVKRVQRLAAEYALAFEDKEEEERALIPADIEDQVQALMVLDLVRSLELSLEGADKERDVMISSFEKSDASESTDNSVS